ncbi:MAG: radical SAM protein [Granulosicoccus sp.]
MGPTGSTRIVQIHPTRKCNLSCKHCYSSSSPQATDTLEPAVLIKALDDLAAEGYNWVTFSGGEPLAYDHLPTLLEHARHINMKTTLVTNGMLLTDKRLDTLEHHIDGLVISLDGTPESHNLMRNSPRAFETMENNLSKLCHRGISFAFLFTLTQNNLDELPWVVDFSVASGANGLMVHPLEITGNATQQLQGKSPDKQESAIAWLLIEKLKKKHGGRLNISLNMVHTALLEKNPDAFFLGDYPTPLKGSLSDLLSGLVIEPDGEVVPLQYGFPRQYSLGNLKDDRISHMVSGWQNKLGPRLHQLSAELYATLGTECNGQFINWYEKLDQYASQTQPLPFPTIKTVESACVPGIS